MKGSYWKKWVIDNKIIVDVLSTYGKRLTTIAKNENLKQFGEELNKNYKENKRIFWNIIKTLKGRRIKQIHALKVDTNR